MKVNRGQRRQWALQVAICFTMTSVIGERRTGNDLEGNAREIVPALTCKGRETGQ